MVKFIGAFLSLSGVILLGGPVSLILSDSGVKSPHVWADVLGIGLLFCLPLIPLLGGLYLLVGKGAEDCKSMR